MDLSRWKLPFGKYAGRTLVWLLFHDPGYFCWLLRRDHSGPAQEAAVAARRLLGVAERLPPVLSCEVRGEDRRYCRAPVALIAVPEGYDGPSVQGAFEVCEEHRRDALVATGNGDFYTISVRGLLTFARGCRIKSEVQRFARRVFGAHQKGPVCAHEKGPVMGFGFAIGLAGRLLRPTCGPG